MGRNLDPAQHKNTFKLVSYLKI